MKIDFGSSSIGLTFAIIHRTWCCWKYCVKLKQYEKLRLSFLIKSFAVILNLWEIVFLLILWLASTNKNQTWMIPAFSSTKVSLLICKLNSKATVILFWLVVKWILIPRNIYCWQNKAFEYFLHVVEIEWKLKSQR